MDPWIFHSTPKIYFADYDVYFIYPSTFFREPNYQPFNIQTIHSTLYEIDLFLITHFFYSNSKGTLIGKYNSLTLDLDATQIFDIIKILTGWSKLTNTKITISYYRENIEGNFKTLLTSSLVNICITHLINQKIDTTTFPLAKCLTNLNSILVKK